MNNNLQVLEALTSKIDRECSDHSMFFRICPEPLLIMQPRTEGCPLGQIAQANPAWERYGQMPGDLIGKCPEELVPPEDKKTLLALWEKAEKKGWANSTVLPLRDSTTWLSWVVAVDEEGYIYANLQDVTELRESEHRYRSLIEIAPVAIGVHSGGKILFANTRGAELLGADPAELIGMDILDFVHPDSKDEVLNRVQKQHREGGTVPMLDEKWRRLDGSVIDVEAAAAHIFWMGKSSVQVVSTPKKAPTAKQIKKESIRALEAMLQKLKEGCDG